METVFITIHDLSLDARIKYASDSVEDILGYLPGEVKDKSCWEFFHPDEIPFARAIHGRGIQLDKAAALHYCRVKHKDGSWIGCECVFTIVYDVLIASTSIYRRNKRSRQRALDAPAIRRIFASSPRDPRYHMLQYISAKFLQTPQPQNHEPRAALFLNRFTRTSTIMYSTPGVASILGVRPEDLLGKSFYFCIAENCLKDAVGCLESAKANDSIAYLRFWYQNPLRAVDGPQEGHGDEAQSDEDDGEGGVRLATTQRETPDVMESGSPDSPTYSEQVGTSRDSSMLLPDDSKSRSSSGNSTDLDGNANDQIFDNPQTANSSDSSVTPAEEFAQPHHPVEIEAVVSCTSDGLVVVLRHARPMAPSTLDTGRTAQDAYPHGQFAAPWAEEPLIPHGVTSNDNHHVQTRAPVVGPERNTFMSTIRDVAVFAWSLTGINGDLVRYGHGTPSGESLPPGGLPVWDPTHEVENDHYNGFSGGNCRPLGRQNAEYVESEDDSPVRASESEGAMLSSSESEDEVLYKRQPMMPEWRRPKRRAHEDAFGSEAEEQEVPGRPASDREARRRRLLGP